LITTVGLFLIAPWIADVYAEPQMSSMLRVMGLSLILEAVAYVPDGLLRKELRFKDRVVPEIAGIFVAAAVTVALLLSGVGVVSYAIGYVAENVVRPVLIVRIAMKKIRWWPRLRVSGAYFKELFSYAKHIVGTEMVKYVSSNLDFLIVGRVLGAGALGFYALAFNLANYPVTNFALILSKIAFPAFATLQEDRLYARRVYLRMVQLLAAVVAPVLVVLALLANPLIMELLGAKWQPAVFPLQAMVLAGISRAVSIPSSDMLRAIGLPDVPFKIGLIEGLVLLGALLLVARQGIVAVSLTVAVSLSLAAWAVTVAACRALGIRLRELASALVPGTALAASGAAAVLSMELLDLGFLPGAVELVALFAVAGAAIALCLATICRGFFWEVVAFVNSARSKEASS
jgi:PST family polysaccharide transporter